MCSHLGAPAHRHESTAKSEQQRYCELCDFDTVLMRPLGQMKLWYHTRRMTNAVSNDAVNAMSVLFYSSGVLLTFHYLHCLSPGRTLAVGFEFRIQNLKSTPIRGSSTSTGFRCWWICCHRKLLIDPSGHTVDIFDIQMVSFKSSCSCSCWGVVDLNSLNLHNIHGDQV